MARVRIELPDQFHFSTRIPVRITDLNYGGHVGNDSILTLLHEARVQFLAHYGYRELDLEGAGLIMADVAIEFRSELFYGEELIASVRAAEFSKMGFELYYKLEKQMIDGRLIEVTRAKTGMVCFDYGTKKVTRLPEAALLKLQ